MNSSLETAILILIVGAVCMSCVGAPEPTPQQLSPMVESIRTHDRLEDHSPPGEHFSFDWGGTSQAEGFEVCRANATGSPVLLIHFHGSPAVVNQAAHKSGRQIRAATINLGSGSSRYEGPLSEQGAFGQMLAGLRNQVTADCKAVWDQAIVVVSSFSAGYGAVRAVLREVRESIDALILLDGLHTDYVPDRMPLAEGGELDTEKLEPFLSFARESMNGSNTMLITHSAIFPGTYASTTETADYLLSTLALGREAVLEWGPVGTQLLSKSESGKFTVLGFAGNTAPDHMDHLHGLPTFLEKVLSEHK